MISPQWMLLAGISLSFFLQGKIEVSVHAKKWSGKILQLSVIFLGAALNFNHVLQQGASGVVITLVSISLIFTFGLLGVKLLKIEKDLGILITMGTAICGGSAIGALAPVISASSMAMTVSIGIVFLLNALAVFIFPPIGHVLSLTQEQFGLWSAIAIHDTSAVVASASIYGKEALAIASTVKLTRALWIIPIVLIFSFASGDNKGKVTIPWFIVGFVISSLLFTFVPDLAPWKENILWISKTGFALTLFLIGLTFNPQQLKQVGARPFILGFTLWISVSIGALLFVMR